MSSFVSSDPLDNLTNIYQRPILINANRAPTTNDVQPPGTQWLDSSANPKLLYDTTGAGVWALKNSSAGTLDTLTADSGGPLTPVGNNLNILGTSSQITTAGSGDTITLTIPSTFVAPGSIASTTTLTAGSNLSVVGNATVGGTLSVTGTVTFAHIDASSVTVTGLSTLGALTQVGTANINATGSAVTNIGGSSGALTITAGAGNLAVVGGGHTLGIGNDAAANVVVVGSTTASASLTLQSGSGGNTVIAGNVAATITIGASAQTGKISIADSTAAMPAVDLMNGVAAGAQVLNIASGASASGAQTVNVLNGATPGASQTLAVMAGIASAGTQSVQVLGGANTTGSQNFQVFNGAIAGATESMSLFSGSIASGTCTFNLFNGNASGGTLVANIFGSVAATTAGTVNIGTGACAHVTNIGSSSGGNVTILGGSSATIGIGLGGNAAQIITIGASAQTGKISVGDSTAALTVDVLNGVAASSQTLNIASGTSSSAAQVVNLLSGTTPGANTTLNIMCGAASAGTQTVNMLATGATRAGAVNIGTGAAAHVLTIGSTNGAASTTLQAGTGSVKFSSGQVVKVTAKATADTGYTVLGSDFMIACDPTSGIMTIVLNATPVTGQHVIIVDATGQAGGNTITVDGNGKNISSGGSSAATKAISAAYGSLDLYYNGTIWNAA